MKSELKVIRLDLQASETVILITHLTEFISGSQGRILRLVNKRFELIDSVLAAILGIKYSGFLGLQKVPPYFNDNHWQIVNETHDLENRIQKMEFANVTLHEIDKQLRCLAGYINDTTYGLYEPLQEMKWRQMSERNVKLKTINTELELRTIFNRICQTAKDRQQGSAT